MIRGWSSTLLGLNQTDARRDNRVVKIIKRCCLLMNHFGASHTKIMYLDMFLLMCFIGYLVFPNSLEVKQIRNRAETPPTENVSV